MSASFRTASATLALLLGAACAHREPPGGRSGPAPAKVEARPVTAVPSAAPPAPAPQAAAAPAPIASPAPPPAEPAPPPAVPELLAADGTPLPQTEDRPDAASASLRARLELLFDAIVKDAPELALPAFFPLVAYRQVKAVADPERDYRHRLLQAFERDIHEYHRQLGPEAPQARLVGLELPDHHARWMKPGSEGNRLGYWRVLRSKLRYAIGDRQRGLLVTSFISWRGEWYVVHLNGFE